MAGLFDIIDEMPNTHCGKCSYGNCCEFAKALVKHKTDPSECSVLHGDETRCGVIKEMLKN